MQLSLQTDEMQSVWSLHAHTVNVDVTLVYYGLVKDCVFCALLCSKCFLVQHNSK